MSTVECGFIHTTGVGEQDPQVRRLLDISTAEGFDRRGRV
jgi:hypothetical protein